MSYENKLLLYKPHDYLLNKSSYLTTSCKNVDISIYINFLLLRCREIFDTFKVIGFTLFWYCDITPNVGQLISVSTEWFSIPALITCKTGWYPQEHLSSKSSRSKDCIKSPGSLKYLQSSPCNKQFYYI